MSDREQLVEHFPEDVEGVGGSGLNGKVAVNHRNMYLPLW